ncbi:TPA: NAD(P)H-dependent oxidoreductase [Citrobacter freundii]|nr:NAD(P)H-dependent oxidoreductase [Citrobacter freundii]
MSILMIVSHPDLNVSRVNKRLLKEVSSFPQIRVHNIYKEYPSGVIDIKAEQSLLKEYDLIIFQQPMYWYNVPYLLKKWQEDVFTRNWAYGSQKNLLGKSFLFSFTLGSAGEEYSHSGKFEHTVDEFLQPIEGLAKFMGVNLLPYFIVNNAHKISEDELNEYAERFNKMLERLTSGFN